MATNLDALITVIIVEKYLINMRIACIYILFNNSVYNSSLPAFLNWLTALIYTHNHFLLMGTKYSCKLYHRTIDGGI